ncbi:tripartite ATP-independent transporter DctP family solute receptor [Luteimonas cucumeris]|uniref:Tripartite ATP-independent transporter DctP family solute receptor n=1 Tax=Luteimonas cucumeris TaxID=985012 RepID=A0A562LDM8_9GAMM|nr:TRAP transporter substrate-binding protein [Luteimonas cucumeris]TWI05789.1 tripartite ATP-independent transporter DctP family solute receptor [Luteimonas cucumeris]
MSSSRRQFIAFGLGALASASLPRAFAAAPTTLLRAADVHIDGYPTVEAVRWIGRYLRERTDGRLDTLAYHSGQLGRESVTVDLARFNALALTRVYLASMNDSVPSTRILSLPFLIDSTEHLRRVLDGQLGRALLADFQRRDLVGLAFYDSGSRNLYNTQRPIHEPADMQGLKLRVPVSEVFVRLVHALGANATPLPFGEIFSALQTRLIDGAENNIKSFQSSRHYEVAHYWSESRHTYTPDVLLMSQKAYEALAPADRELVREAAAASVPYMRGLWDQAEAAAAKAVFAAEVRANQVDRESMRRATDPVSREYLGDAGLAKLFEYVREAM